MCTNCTDIDDIWLRVIYKPINFSEGFFSNEYIKSEIEKIMKKYCACSSKSPTFIRFSSGDTYFDLTIDLPLYDYKLITEYLECTLQILSVSNK